jgi:uncharacterized protein with HEPN domain
MDTRDRDWLAMIVRYGEEVLAWARHNPDWASDRKDTAAIVHNLAQIGDIAERKVSRTVAMANPQVAWKGVGKMRHIIVHDYSATSFDITIIAASVKNDLPHLVAAVRDILDGD